jgi:GH24 family phage-related lysozyme (muramidase)
MQRAKKFIDQVVEAQPEPIVLAKAVQRPAAERPAIHKTAPKTDPVLSQDFIDYLKRVENREKAGFKNGRWFPHSDPSGGYNVGYGHHIQSNAEYNQLLKTGLSDAQVMDLLTQDILDAKEKVDEYVKKRYGVRLYLEPKQYQMLIDYIFNIGNLEGFPKMADAVVRSNLAAMKKEYKRTGIVRGKRKELTARNTEFANKFLAQSESIA